MLTQLSLSALRSDNVSYGLANTQPMQSRLVLANEGSFNFNTLLENVIDVKSKNYTMFYLTQKTNIINNTIDIPLPYKQNKITTTLGFRTSALSYTKGVSSTVAINNTYRLAFSAQGSTNCLFTINFLDSTSCTISHNDGLGEYYAVMNNLSGLDLKRSVFISTSSDSVFRYVVSSDSIIITKGILNGSNIDDYQFCPVGNRLSAVQIGTNTGLFNLSALSIVGNPTYLLDASLNNCRYVKYVEIGNSLISNQSTSITGVPCNYLLYKNLHSNPINEHKIIVLKNQFTDSGMASRGDNLVLSAEKTDITTNLRTYTSIFNNIETEEDTGLELNYVSYNKSIPIVMGLNYFKTGNSMAPYSKININDTSFTRQGSFASISPRYADKVYYIEKTNIDTERVLLCTWLYGDIYNNDNKKVWLDRYYYPDLITKQAALSGVQLFSPTFKSFAEKNIFNTASLLSSVKIKQYYDKISDFVFIPESNYIYERTNLELSNILISNDINAVNTGYYNTINSNGGMFLAFDIINYNSLDYFTIKSDVNNIEGGININFNRDEIGITCTLFDTASSNYITIDTFFELPAAKKVSIILNINTNTGELKAFVDGKLVANRSFRAYYYSRLLYGDILANEQPLELINRQFTLNEDVTNYINNVVLSVFPLADEELIAFAAGDSRRSAESLYISIPNGFQNNTDEILQLNSFATNQKSKSSNVDVYISGLSSVSETLRGDLAQYLATNTIDLLPLATELQNINIV